MSLRPVVLVSRRRRCAATIVSGITMASTLVAAGATASVEPVDAAGPLAAVDWRNHGYDVACGGEAAAITLTGGRWTDPERHDPPGGSLRAMIFDGAIALPGHDDVVLVRLGCVAGEPSAPVSSSTLVYVRVDADAGAAAAQLAAISFPPTNDITVAPDGRVLVGHRTQLGEEPACCPEGYVTFAVTWVDGVPVAQEPVAAERVAHPAPDLGGLDDPTAGLPATPPAIPVELPDVPAEPACVGVELAPGYGDPSTNGLLQAALERRGFDTGTDRGDGEFGAATHAALTAWVEANRAVLTSFTGGDDVAIDTVIDEALTTGAVRLPLLDALGIGCAAGVLPLEVLTSDGETSPNDW